MNKRHSDDVLLELAQTQNQLVEELIEFLRNCRERYRSVEARLEALERQCDARRTQGPRR